MIISQYNESNSGKLWFTELNQMTLPTTNETLRLMATTTKFPIAKFNQTVLDESLESNIIELFKAELDYQRKIDSIQRDLNSRSDFDIKISFNLVCNDSTLDYLDREAINSYTNQYIRSLSENELDAIIRRCDTDCDQILSYPEFADIIQRANFSSNSNLSSKPKELPPKRVYSPNKVIKIKLFYI